jgi:hypothetical protein
MNDSTVRTTWDNADSSVGMLKQTNKQTSESLEFQIPNYNTNKEAGQMNRALESKEHA